ncbi:hypothetical protein [Salinibacterium sp. NYA9b]
MSTVFHPHCRGNNRDGKDATTDLVTALAISSFNLRSIATFFLKLRGRTIEKPIRARRRKVENKRPLARTVSATKRAVPMDGEEKDLFKIFAVNRSNEECGFTQ